MNETDDKKHAAEPGGKREPERRAEVREPDAPQTPAEPQDNAAPQARIAADEPPHIRTARRFWILSIVNWAVAIVCWGISSYLGVARPTNMFVYTILFVVGIVAVIIGFLCWLVARFGTEPAQPSPDSGGAR
jgi:hypothetical protein